MEPEKEKTAASKPSQKRRQTKPIIEKPARQAVTEPDLIVATTAQNVIPEPVEEVDQVHVIKPEAQAEKTVTRILPGKKKQKFLMLQLEDPVVFEPGSFELTDENIESLGIVLEILQKRTGYRMLVEGMADPEEGAPGELASISKTRSDKVCAWLAGKGLDTSRFRCVGMGDATPYTREWPDHGEKGYARVGFLIEED